MKTTCAEPTVPLHTDHTVHHPELRTSSSASICLLEASSACDTCTPRYDIHQNTHSAQVAHGFSVLNLETLQKFKIYFQICTLPVEDKVHTRSYE